MNNFLDKSYEQILIMIQLHNSINELVIQNVYIVKNVFLSMTKESWKCFRCNLLFTDLEHAMIHEDLTKHKTSLVKNITA